MNQILRAVCCGAILAPGLAQAEIDFGGQVVLGYGEVDDIGEGYGILDLTASNATDLDGIKLDWKIRGRVRSDQDEIGKVEANNIDAAIGLDFGAGGKLGLTTFVETYDQKPWADGDLFNRGSVGVFPVLQKRYDGVTDSQFSAGGPAGEKVDPDLILTYENRFGPVGFDLAWNVLQTWDGYERSEMADGGEAFAIAEAKLTIPTEGYGIYSLRVNDIRDAEARVVFPMPQRGLTMIGTYTINEGNADEYLGNVAAIYRAKDMGLLKGAFLAHAFNDTDTRSVVSIAFGDDTWELKVGGDSDGDYAVEGSYNFSESSSLLFGWDNGFDNPGGPGDGFDDDAFPAPVFAAGRGNAFEIAFVQKF